MEEVPRRGSLAPGTIALIGIGVVLTGVLLILVFGRNSPPGEPERSRAGPTPTPPQATEAAAKGRTELESQIHAAVAAEDFKKALDCLAQASGRTEDPQWARVVNQWRSEAEKTAASLYATVNQRAIEAQTRLDIPELEKIRARITRWGVGKYLSDFDQSFDIAGLKRKADERGARTGPEPGLVAYFTFAEGSGAQVEDLSGLGHAARVMGGAKWSSKEGPPIPQKIPGALLLDSKPAHVRVPHSPTLDFGAGSFTIAAWICPLNDAPGRLINKWTGTFGWLMDVNSGFKHAVAPGMLRFKANDGKNEVEMAAPAVLGKDGRTWTHVGVTLDRTSQELKLFANGAQIGQTKKTAAVTGSLANSVDLGLGALLWKPDDTFKGYVGEVRLYTRALSAQEIQGLFQPSARR